MDIGNILNTGVQGLQQATSRANEAAQSIASQQVTDTRVEPLNNKSLTTSLVDLKQAEIDVKANVKVVEVASDLVGSLLDITV